MALSSSNNSTRQKPWETNRTSNSSNFRVSSSVANGRNVPEVPDSQPVSSTSNGSLHIRGSSSLSSPLSSAGTNSISLPARPSSLMNSGGGYGSRFGSSYSSPYSSPYGGGYGSSRYGGGYGGSYSSGYGLGSYNSFGSSYGSGYGSYGSSYGRMGYGSDRPFGQQGMIMNQIGRFGQLVESFSSFSFLLNNNLDAMNGSFMSIHRMVEVMGELFGLVRTFAIIKFLFSPLVTLWRILIGAPPKRRKITSKDQNNGFDVKDYSSFGSSKSKWSRGTIITLALSLLGIPILLLRMWNIHQRSKRLAEGKEDYEEYYEDDEPQFESARALVEFRGQDSQDLSLREGEIIKIIAKVRILKRN
eukprot:TRINITY_DN879_c0_g1_i3.p1 TRINITY_DN879_c0_g1~~TRINITY_DN879_c0_g1_i3.p1  ORF type:complete len:359 (+),score=79.24 TRINITY_DN879_c0_g1_i3:207-1283(+)